jgi:hypothetical protein
LPKKTPVEAAGKHAASELLDLPTDGGLGDLITYRRNRQPDPNQTEILLRQNFPRPIMQRRGSFPVA